MFMDKTTRTKLTAIVTQFSGAKDVSAMYDLNGNLSISGEPSQVRKAAAWVNWLGRETGRPITATVETYEDDPGFAVCRTTGMGL
jgi:hypothetical protein